MASCDAILKKSSFRFLPSLSLISFNKIFWIKLIQVRQTETKAKGGNLNRESNGDFGHRLNPCSLYYVFKAMFLQDIRKANMALHMFLICKMPWLWIRQQGTTSLSFQAVWNSFLLVKPWVATSLIDLYFFHNSSTFFAGCLKPENSFSKLLLCSQNIL